MNEVVKRRLEFLKLEAKGFSLREIMKLLSEKFQTSEKNIYYYAETRDTWQPILTQLFDLDKARLIVKNRYDCLYRQASLHFQTASEAQKKGNAIPRLNVPSYGIQSITGNGEIVKSYSEKRIADYFKKIT